VREVLVLGSGDGGGAFNKAGYNTSVISNV